MARENFLGRCDLYYPFARLALEYDGGSHRSTLAEDHRRQNRFVDAGIRFLRFTAGDIYNHRSSVVTLVRAALGLEHTTGFRWRTNGGCVRRTVEKRRRAPAHPEPFGQGERSIS